MSHGHGPKCPQCGTTLTEDQLICHICDTDVTHLTRGNTKIDKPGKLE